MLLLCDHASNAIPEEFDSLGMPETELQRHIAYDIGAAMVTRTMAAALGAPAVLSTFSRLLIDPNRGLDDPTLVMKLSDGAVVPGNKDADAAEVERRIARFYAPYDRAVGEAVEAALAAGRAARHRVDAFLHAVLEGRRAALARHGAVGQRSAPAPAASGGAGRRRATSWSATTSPMTARSRGDTMNRHATRRGLSNVLIEVRQDLIATPQGAQAWGERLARVLRPILADPAQHRIEHPSHPHRHPTARAFRLSRNALASRGARAQSAGRATWRLVIPAIHRDQGYPGRAPGLDPAAVFPDTLLLDSKHDEATHHGQQPVLHRG